MILKPPSLMSLFFFLTLSFSSLAMEENRHADKVALVTGASRGIGFSLTEHLLKDGLQVIGVARNVESLINLKQQFPNQLHIISADLSTKKGRLSIAPYLDKTPIDFLIHNAAIIDPLGTNALLESCTDDIERIINVNVIAPIVLTRQLSPNLKTGSRVLMVSSRAGDRMSPGIGLYCISKVALDRYTESLQLDKPHGILAATVHPGDVDTDMQGDLRLRDTSDFPRGEFFRSTKSKLITQEVSAKYLKWLLLNTSNEAFTARKHNIYDPFDNFSWNNGVVVEDPYL